MTIDYVKERVESFWEDVKKEKGVTSIFELSEKDYCRAFYVLSDEIFDLYNKALRYDNSDEIRRQIESLYPVAKAMWEHDRPYRPSSYYDRENIADYEASYIINVVRR